MKKLFVSFVSNETNYVKEECGLKPNTVRKIDLTDDRFKNLVYWNILGKNGKYENKYIQIHKFVKPSKENFMRKIKDISFWENLVIISWEHKHKPPHPKED